MNSLNIYKGDVNRGKTLAYSINAPVSVFCHAVGITVKATNNRKMSFH